MLTSGSEPDPYHEAGFSSPSSAAHIQFLLLSNENLIINPQTINSNVARTSEQDFQKKKSSTNFFVLSCGLLKSTVDTLIPKTF
jgi:hypothetical protein